MSNKNEMAPHFRKAIEEMDGDIFGLAADIQKLQSARKAIVDLYGGESEVAELPKEMPIVRKKAKKRAAKADAGGGQAASSVAGPGRAMDANTIGLMIATRKAVEPFTAMSLHVASGFETKLCANRLLSWAARGWVQKVARGQFSRTKDFPAETPATE